MSRLLADDVHVLPLQHEPVDPADVVAGLPTTAATALLGDVGVEIGVWEITSGVVTDVEVDEVFVVLSGRGRLDLDDGTSIALSVGTVVRLSAGDRTTWYIDETLRKVYILLPTTEGVVT